MIRTWVADVSTLHDEARYLRYYRQVPVYRQKKADSLLTQEDKALSVGAWVLFQKMKQEYGLGEDIVYNLSHSGTCVLCSVDDSGNSDRKLGCDLEQIKTPRLKVAKRFFCESEYQIVLEKQEMFYRYWVLKESYMKATRMGMKLGMDKFEIGFTKEDKPYLKMKPPAFQEECYFQEYTIKEIPYRIAVCSDCDEFVANIQLKKIE